jgi:hypothetical protein
MNEQWVDIRIYGKKRIYVRGVNINHYEFFTLKVESEAIWITLMIAPKKETLVGRKFSRERRANGIRKLVQTTKGVILQGITTEKFLPEATHFTLPSFGTSTRREIPIYCPESKEGVWWS